MCKYALEIVKIPSNKVAICLNFLLIGQKYMLLNISMSDLFSFTAKEMGVPGGYRAYVKIPIAIIEKLFISR